MSVPRSIAIIDETPGTGRRPALTLRVASEKVLAGDIVRARVRTEVEAFNSTDSDVFRGLIEPEGAERILNGFRLGRKKRIDIDAQINEAVNAIAANRVIMFVDERQVEDLDEEVALTEHSEVVFLKLVPLVGG